MRRAFLVVLLLVAGCGDGGSAPAGGAEAREESPHVVSLGSPSGSERRYVNTVGEWVFVCSGTVEEYAGPPPSPRMAELARRASAACAGDGEVDDVVTLIAGYELHWGSGRELPVKEGRTHDSRIEPRFGAAVARLTGSDVEVRCWSEEDWRAVAAAGSPYDDDAGGGAEELAGFVADDRRIHLAPTVCADLVRLAYDDEREVDDHLAFAVVALAHEARHTMGELREDHTECWAVQNGEELARELGAGEALARELALHYWEEIYPRQEPPYASDECRDGGELDLDRRSDRWP